MSSTELTKKLVTAVRSGRYNTITYNCPNSDMIGHTRVMEVAVKTIEAPDHYVEEIARAVGSMGGQLLITADRGNAGQMRNPAANQIYTVHVNLSVPLIYVDNKNMRAAAGGKLSDIVPTMLSLAGIEIPREMAGKPLFITE